MIGALPVPSSASALAARTAGAASTRTIDGGGTPSIGQYGKSGTLDTSDRTDRTDMTDKTRLIDLHHTDRPRLSCRADRGGRRAGFTIVEMLVTVAIIVILITILVVALSQAARGAQRARTVFLMTSINQGLTQFKTDHGYLPPVLGRNGPGAQNTDRDARVLPDPGSPAYITQLQDYRSATSLAEFLLGYGDRSEDGYGIVGAAPGGTPGFRESPPLGFRSPGPDGLWGAWTNPRPNFPAGGQLGSRNPGGLVNPPLQGSVQYNNDQMQGKVYGPYIDPKDERLLGGIDALGKVFLPGDDGYLPNLPKVIVDYWGQPILYYRRLHQPRNPAAVDLRSNLGDVFLLRPWEIGVGEDTNGALDENPDITSIPPGSTTALPGDNSTTRALRAAEFVLFSAGPDRAFDGTRRIDEKAFNRDNITEIGQ